MNRSRKAIMIRVFCGAFFVASLLEIINSISSVVDSYFVGHYVGSLGVAGQSLVRPYFSLVGIIGGTLGLGMQLVCSGCIAKGETDKSQKVFSGVLTFSLIISLLLTFFGMIRTEAFISVYGTRSGMDEVGPFAICYLKGLFIGTPAIILYGILTPIVQLADGKRRITVSMIVHIIAAVAGDVISVFVFHGGMEGIGLATALSYYFALLPFVSYFIRKDALFKIRLSFLPFSDLKSVLNSGAAVAIKRVCNTLKPIILNSFSLILGTSLAVSAYGITNQVRDFLISFSAGVAGSVVLIGALIYAEKNREGLEFLAKISIVSIGAIAAVGALIMISSEKIAAFFITDSSEVLEMASVSIRCVGLMIPISTINGVFVSFMQITKRFKVANTMSFLNRLVLLVVTSAVLGAAFGIDGLWWAFPVSEIVNVIIEILTVWKITGKFPVKIMDFLCVSDDFGYNSDNKIEFSPRSIEDVSDILDQVKEFCVSRKVDDRRTFYTQLVIEELTANVIQHGFPKCKKKPLLSVYLLYDEDEIYLRIQDNCPKFNVRDYCSGLSGTNPEHGVGLRCVSRFSKDMQYMNILETNTLTITM